MASQFVLIIGIDKYESDLIQNITGAVADAREVAGYFRRRGVPLDQITVLEDSAATRDAILREFRRLADDPRIQHGDSIVISYAGHGSQAAAPTGWEAGGREANIQLTLPYDVFCKSGGKEVPPIPDRTLGALLEVISQTKGDNIVVIMDSCYSASGTRGSSDLSDMVRSSPIPSDFKLSEDLDQDIWSFIPIHGGLRSHVLLSASSSSGQAWESHGRGDFTVALLKLLENSQTDKIRYCDILHRIKIDPRQTPHCEGFNHERYLFTTTSYSTECFIPVYTQTSKDEKVSQTLVLNGGAAHGLRAGDEFSLHPDIDSLDSQIGTVVVQRVGSFYSTIQSPDHGTIVTYHTVATRIKEGRRQPLRVYCGLPDAKDFDLLAPLRDSIQKSTKFDIVPTPKECDIDISLHGDQAVVRLMNISTTHGCHIRPTTLELARILEASWHFFLELERTSNCPDITEHIRVDFDELTRSQSRFPGAPLPELLPRNAVPYQSDSFTVRQGSSYGLKLTNNSPHDLYPTVQCFNLTDGFQIDTMYRPGFGSDVPLRKDGGSLTIGYGSGGSPPLVIPFPGRLAFLKISFFSRPLDPFHDAHSFRSARHIPEDLQGPWATIIRRVDVHPSAMQMSFFKFQQPVVDFAIDLPIKHIIKPHSPRSHKPYYSHSKGVEPLLDTALPRLPTTENWPSPSFTGSVFRWLNRVIIRWMFGYF